MAGMLTESRRSEIRQRVKMGPNRDYSVPSKTEAQRETERCVWRQGDGRQTANIYYSGFTGHHCLLYACILRIISNSYTFFFFFKN